MAKKDRINWDDVRWTPFEEAVAADDTPQHVLEYREKYGVKTFRNSIYQVEARGVLCPPPFGKTVWLSFKTLDKQPRHDWREMQRIKNELLHEECEAVELFPAETRLVDTSNQYHLWCFPFLDMPNKRFPFGYKERLISEGSTPGIAVTGKGSRQRDFREEFRVVDLLRQHHLDALSLTTTKEIVKGRCPFDWSPLLERGGQFFCLKHQHRFTFDGKDTTMGGITEKNLEQYAEEKPATSETVVKDETTAPETSVPETQDPSAVPGEEK